MLITELTLLVTAESLMPMAEAESLAQLVAGDPLSPLTPAEPLAESVLVEQRPVQPARDQRRRRLRLPIRRLPR